MKFQDSSFNCLKVTVGTKSVTHPRTNARSKSNVPHQLFETESKTINNIIWNRKRKKMKLFSLFS